MKRVFAIDLSLNQGHAVPAWLRGAVVRADLIIGIGPHRVRDGKTLLAALAGSLPKLRYLVGETDTNEPQAVVRALETAITTVSVPKEWLTMVARTRSVCDAAQTAGFRAISANEARTGATGGLCLIQNPTAAAIHHPSAR